MPDAGGKSFTANYGYTGQCLPYSRAHGYYLYSSNVMTSCILVARLWMALAGGPPAFGGPADDFAGGADAPTAGRGAWCLLGGGTQAAAFSLAPQEGPLYALDGAGHKFRLIYRNRQQQIVAEVAALPAGLYAICGAEGVYLGCLAVGPKER